MSSEMFILTINEYCKCLCFLPCCLQTKIKTGQLGATGREKMKNYFPNVWASEMYEDGQIDLKDYI